MNVSFKLDYLAALSAFFSGLIIYFILVHLSIASGITVPTSIVISILIFGLTKFYSVPAHSKEIQVNDMKLKNYKHDSITTTADEKTEVLSETIFVIFFAILILISSFSFSRDFPIFVNWNEIDTIELIQLGAAIILCFFMPGFALVQILGKKHGINPILKILLSYFISMLITGLTVYISSLNLALSGHGIKFLLVTANSIILIAFVTYYRTHKIIFSANIYNINESTALFYFKTIVSNIRKWLTVHLSEAIVFGAILGLLIIYTYFVYGGITIGDQWYHQNRAFLLMSWQFKDSVLSDGDVIYPPFQSTILAGLSLLSGIPLVNAFASIAFLNMTTVFAFYFFVSTWLPPKIKKAALFASSLFAIASGFDWTYIISNLQNAQTSQITSFFLQQIRASDLIYAPNFLIAAFPDFSTPLILIAIPAGFVLLGTIRSEFNNKFILAAIISAVTILGMLSHDEFYLFIIISSILPIVFNIGKRNSVYMAFLFAFGFVYIVDGMLPVKYFTSNPISEMPLFNIAVVFVLIMWATYTVQQNLFRRFHSSRISKIMTHRARLRSSINLLKIVPVWTVAYVFIFGFIVWTQLPPNYIDIQRDGSITPWYFYPMRLGVVGVLGLACILSYLFKRFEKEVFVFGIMIVIALLAGPFYDEQRFTKYVMAGMIGFASVLIFKIVSFVADKKPAINTIIIGSIILSASISTLLFIGYNALIFQTDDYTYALGRRNFPNMEQMGMLDLMRSEIHTGSNTSNVAALPYEYNTHEEGLMTKLHAFSGLPHTRILQAPLILNTSRLDSLYHLLEMTHTGSIIIPTQSYSDEILPGPTRFALENFKQIYGDGNYRVLKVPSLKGSSKLPSNNSVGLIYKEDKSLLPQGHIRSLLYDNSTFDFKNDTVKSAQIIGEGQIKMIVLYGYKKQGEKTLWSKQLEPRDKINYFETRLMIRGENKTGKDTAGLRWTDGNDNVYLVSLSNAGLELRSKAHNDNKTLLLSKNAEVKKKDGIWYLIKVAVFDNTIKIYLDDELKIKFSGNKLDKNMSGITKIGIASAENIVEFEAIKTAKVKSNQVHDNINKYTFDYPLSSVALSANIYDVYADGDYSIFSEKAIILPYDPLDWTKVKFQRFIDYARSGGTLVVLNSDDNLNGSFSKFFSIVPDTNVTNFTSILDQSDQSFINISGMVRKIELNPSPDIRVVASYINYVDKAITPFAIEKVFDNGGRIILVNSKAYFDSINLNPKRYFQSLGHLQEILNVKFGKSVVGSSKVELIRTFSGNAIMSGNISINGSSILGFNGQTPINSTTLNVDTISILNNNGNLERQFQNASVTNMKISGKYSVSVNAKGTSSILADQSQSDYARIILPSNYNMSLGLDSKSLVEIYIANGTHYSTIKVNNDSKIIFTNIKSIVPFVKYFPLVIKNPTIIVQGNANFERVNFYGDPEKGGLPLNVAGTIKLDLDFIDHYNEHYDKGRKTKYVSYLDSIDIDGKLDIGNGQFKLPGDISFRAKNQGLVIPLTDILSSASNIIAIISLTAIMAITAWLLRRFILV